MKCKRKGRTFKGMILLNILETRTLAQGKLNSRRTTSSPFPLVLDEMGTSSPSLIFYPTVKLCYIKIHFLNSSEVGARREEEGKIEESL